ncbi:MAG: hypothetical protein JW953_21230 [Anaerolineae bacterium]|nr:hypothetical protein [Anaerolineae bacterium]
MTNLKCVLQQLPKNLNHLKEREARQSSRADLRLLNQIDDHQEAIGLVEQTIRGDITQTEMEDALKPLDIDHSLLKMGIFLGLFLAEARFSNTTPFVFFSTATTAHSGTWFDFLTLPPSAFTCGKWVEGIFLSTGCCWSILQRWR